MARISIDLTTLSGWSSLEDGEYEITVGAKADGYTRVIQSSGVTVEKETIAPVSGNFLTFSSPSTFELVMILENADDFSELQTGVKSWDGTLEYSTDNETWTTWNGTAINSVSNGTSYVLYLRGTSNTYITGDGIDLGDDNYGQYRFKLTGSDISVNGNIENLLDYTMVANGQHPPMAYCCFFNLFADNPIISTPSMPATTLEVACYAMMYAGCSYLVTLPALPATRLAESCYLNMFWGSVGIQLGSKNSSRPNAFRIPSSGAGINAANALAGMFDFINGGQSQFTVNINTTYYTNCTIVSAQGE